MTNISVTEGDCLDVLRALPEKSVNLIVTSPPYGKQRDDVYGGVDPEKYSEWFIPRAREMKRVLRDDGSFILNIWEHVEKGLRHPYVLRLVLDMIDDGWLWIEEYIWRKINPIPGRTKNRVRDCWEHLYHFSKTTDIKCFTEAVDVPARWKPENRRNLDPPKSTNGSGLSGTRMSRKKQNRRERNNGSGFGTNDDRMSEQRVAMAHNIIETTIGGQKESHPATFPIEIPRFFINLFTETNDTVLDPFAGSGTTLFTAYNMGRHSIGVEISSEYCAMIDKGIRGLSMRLPM